jgi:secreted trypsin-like serine protease
MLLDTCQGDSGGPLMHFEPNERQWVLAGVTSYGRGCGLPSYAGVYTRASVYDGWLRSIIADDFVTLPINITSFNSADPTRSILSFYWLLGLSLFVFSQK